MSYILQMTSTPSPFLTSLRHLKEVVAEGSRHLQGSLGVQGQLLQNAPSLGKSAMVSPIAMGRLHWKNHRKK